MYIYTVPWYCNRLFITALTYTYLSYLHCPNIYNLSKLCVDGYILYTCLSVDALRHTHAAIYNLILVYYIFIFLSSILTPNYDKRGRARPPIDNIAQCLSNIDISVSWTHMHSNLLLLYSCIPYIPDIPSLQNFSACIIHTIIHVHAHKNTYYHTVAK